MPEAIDIQKDHNEIDAPEADYLYVETSQLPNSGKGLFTAIDILKDEIIAVFKGEILSDGEAKIRANKNQDNYFINMVDGTVMDSMNTACFAKYANDAKGTPQSSFKNNSKIALDDNSQVCIVATRKIKTGEEVFCGYGKKYWKNQERVLNLRTLA